MSDYTLTPNLGLYKPTVNADGDAWGGHWNQNADTLDTAVAGGPFLPLSGGTISGTLTVSTNPGVTTGQFTVGSNGASFFPGYNPGPGGLGVTDLVVGNNGAANPTTAASNFLYISSCAGTPTGVPTQAAIGRIAMTFDTTAHKLWVHDGTRWWSTVAFT